MASSMPLWAAALLLVAGVWLAAHILQNVTAALTAMTAGGTALHTPAAWPPR